MKNWSGSPIPRAHAEMALTPRRLPTPRAEVALSRYIVMGSLIVVVVLRVTPLHDDNNTDDDASEENQNYEHDDESDLSAR